MPPARKHHKYLPCVCSGSQHWVTHDHLYVYRKSLCVCPDFLNQNQSDPIGHKVNAIGSDIFLTQLFSGVYDDFVNRGVTPTAVVYQSFGTVWNLSFKGDPHSVNIGETYRNGKAFAFMQPRKPWRIKVPVADKQIAPLDVPAQLSYLTAYYLLSVRGDLDLAWLNTLYPEANEWGFEIASSMAYIDKYIYS